jgi:hypothetical protein
LRAFVAYVGGAMKALFIAVLAMALVGCAAAPHSDTSGARKSTASKASVKTAKAIAQPKTKAVAKAKHTKTISTSPTAPPERSDPVTERAKAAIAAMLDDPASAEFYKMQRAQKKLLHRPVDTICGHVRSRSASARNKAGMPFLYIVGHDREDEAYLVTGSSHVAQTVHGALCK